MKITVVIPLYQQARQVPRALGSVLAQTRPPDEIIVVDDGSTDGGAQAARAAGGPGVEVLTIHHAGESAARNHGVAAASSEWVAFLDADDEWRPEFLARTTALAESRPDLVAVFSNVMVRAWGRALLRRGPSEPQVLEDYFEALLENSGAGMSSSSVLVRRRDLLACGGFPDRVTIGGDRDTWARLAWTGPVGYVPGCLSTYHADAASRATVRARDRKPEYPAFLATYREWREGGRIPERLRETSARFANRVLAEYAMELAHAGDGRQAEQRLCAEWNAGGPRALYVKARVWAHLPVRLLRCMRTTRGRFRMASSPGSRNRLSPASAHEPVFDRDGRDG
jgi:glycosyltransferase involved in cell wall biosynthesis